MDEPRDPLHELARAAGVQRHWRDVGGSDRQVSDDSLRAVLAALGHRAESARQMQASLADLLRQDAALPAMLTADAGQPITIGFAASSAAVTGVDGRSWPLAVIDGVPQAPPEPGHYDLELDGAATRLAVAPPHCPLPAGRQAGVSLQIPSLRGSRPSPYGTFGELAEAVEALARHGVDAVAINPVHALFAGDGAAFSPYSPSSRRFLNGAMADPALLGLPPLPPREGGPLIDWDTAIPQHLAQLRASYAALTPDQRAAIAAAGAGDAALHAHAVFDALDCRLRAPGKRGWQHWPGRFHDPASPAVAQFARGEADEVAFHAFVQWLAGKGLAAVQDRARAAGMATGLVADLAVGVDKGGSDAWSLGTGMLQGLSIGAPPDPLGPLGQDWALTSFSPEGLRASGYEPWLAMIRAALAHGGGLRIDHAFGLARLWVIPAGGDCAEGAYLSYPFADLLRLLTLEAHLAGACVIAEDLGTAPHGFTQAIAERRLLPMRVLWFQRAEDHGFIGAADYPAQAVAMTGTHDTPTVAGWWSGRDLDWAAKLGRLPDGMDRAGAEAVRDWDRGLLWSTLAGTEPRPAPGDTAPVVEAAISHTLHTPCAMAVVPAEDLLGLTDQPNLPGTIDEHPNWRRRLDLPLAEALAEKAPLARD